MDPEGVQEGLQPVQEGHLRVNGAFGLGQPFVPYVDNLVYVFVDDEELLGDGTYYSQAAEDAAEALGGEVVGKMPLVPEYQVQVEPASYGSLMDMAGSLVDGDGSVAGVTGSRVEMAVLAGDTEVMPAAGSREAFSYVDWGSIIHLGKAWEAMDGSVGAGIGIIDKGFDFTDLNSDIDASELTKEAARSYSGMHHGAYVSWLAGARHSAKFDGCAPKGTYVYASDPEALSGKAAPDMQFLTYGGIMESMMECVSHGCKVLNVSLGMSMEDGGQLSMFRDYMSAYLCRVWRECGRDFLIVQAAGNSVVDDDGNEAACDVSDGLGAFCGITKENLECGMSLYMHSKGYAGNIWQYGMMSTDSDTLYRNLRDRIIIVGGCSGDFGSSQYLGSYSNYGFGVDIYAPGSNIEIHNAPDVDSILYGIRGTSFAAPLVAGTASMVWGKYPGLSAASVKDIVVGGTLHELQSRYPDGYGRLSGTDFVLDAGQALAYAAEYVGAGDAVNTGDVYSRPYGMGGSDALSIGLTSADPHILDQSSKVLPFSIVRSGTVDGKGLYGKGYGLFYPAQAGRDGGVYYRMKKLSSFTKKYGGSSQPYQSFMCIRLHSPAGASYVYSFPEEDEMAACYQLFPAGTLLRDLPAGAAQFAVGSGDRLAKALLFGQSVSGYSGFSM